METFMIILNRVIFFDKNLEIKFFKLILSKLIEDIEEVEELSKKFSNTGKKFVIKLESKFLNSLKDLSELTKFRNVFSFEIPANTAGLENFVNYKGLFIVYGEENNLKKYNVLSCLNINSHKEIESHEGKVDLFFGDYYLNPKVDPGKRVKSNSINVVQTIEMIRNNPEIEVVEIENELKKSPDTLFSLFRYLSTAAFGFKREVTSVRQLVTLLGKNGLEKVLKSFLVAGQETSLYGQILMEEAVFRANLMNVIGNEEKIGGPLYIAGLFSILEALFEAPFERILGSLDIDENIYDLLIEKEGIYKNIFEEILMIEKIYQTGDLLPDIVSHINKVEEAILLS
jgi:c-di-GMP-related signal transduction protein